jgi:hypothetical protein
MHLVKECTRAGLRSGRSRPRHAHAAVPEFGEVSENGFAERLIGSIRRECVEPESDRASRATF